MATGRVFWEVSACKKYTLMFETDDFVLGSDERHEFRMFRKDAQTIGFSEREALETRLAQLARLVEEKDLGMQ